MNLVEILPVNIRNIFFIWKYCLYL
jgi:hypothetical protein